MANRTVNSLPAADAGSVDDVADKLYLARLGSTPTDRKLAVGELLGKQVTVTSSTVINLNDYLGDLVLNCRGAGDNITLTIAGTPKPGRKLIVFAPASYAANMTFESPLVNAGPSTLMPQGIGLWLLGPTSTVVGAIIPSPGTNWAADSSGNAFPLVLGDNGQLKRNAYQYLERMGNWDDANKMIRPGVYGALLNASNLPTGAPTQGTMLVMRGTASVGVYMPARVVQVYTIGDSSDSDESPEPQMWVRDGICAIGDPTTISQWGAWKRIDCDRNRLLPEAGVYYVRDQAEFTAALEAAVPAGTKKVVWVLNQILLYANVSQGTTYRATLTSDVSVYGHSISVYADGFWNNGSALYTIRFFNQYVGFNQNQLKAIQVRLLFKRVLFTTQVEYASTFDQGGEAIYETNYNRLVIADSGSGPQYAYPAPSDWQQKMWDNTAGSGAATMQELFPVSLGNYAIPTTSLTGQVWCARFVAKVSGAYHYLGIFPLSGSAGSFILGVYDAATDALIRQSSAFTPTVTKQVAWQQVNEFTLEAGHEYYFALYASGNQLNYDLLAWKSEAIIGDAALASNRYVGPSGTSLDNPKTPTYGANEQCWMACK